MSTMVLLFLATILWGVWGFADKQAVQHAHPFSVQWMYSIPFVLSIPIWYSLGQRAQPATNQGGAALPWAMLAGAASILALLLLLFAMRSLPASLVVAVTSAYPVVTLLIGVAAGTERFSWTALGGMALVLLGLVVLQSSHR